MTHSTDHQSHVLEATLFRTLHNGANGQAFSPEDLCPRIRGSSETECPGRGESWTLSQGVFHAWGQWIGRADTLRARCPHPATVKVKNPWISELRSMGVTDQKERAPDCSRALSLSRCREPWVRSAGCDCSRSRSVTQAVLVSQRQKITMRWTKIRHKRIWTALFSLVGASLIAKRVIALIQPAGQLLQDPADGSSM